MLTRKGIYYFPSYLAARDYALQHGYPTDRIIAYGIDATRWAIQLRISGPYAGPNTTESV